LPPASKKSIQSSLECLNAYIQKHYDQFVAQESHKRILLVASFARKDKSYQKQIATLKAIHVDIAALLSREQTTNADLRQKLDNAASSVARLCKVVTDANFVFVNRKRAPHEVKQEESSQEGMTVPDVTICPDATVSALLSRIETVVNEMNAKHGAALPSPVDPSPCYSVIDALGRVVHSLLATQRMHVVLQENIKSVDAARVDAECQNESLQARVALFQEELRQVRGDNERISQELAAGTPFVNFFPMGDSHPYLARLEREEHVCRPPTPPLPPVPAAQDDFPVSLPSPPLEQRDLPIQDG